MDWRQRVARGMCLLPMAWTSETVLVLVLYENLPLHTLYAQVPSQGSRIWNATLTATLPYLMP